MILHGDSLEVLKDFPDNSVDAVVTDPPYGLSFMGKKWDYDVPSKELWAEVLRVLKPGGHLLSFGGTRTYHRMVVAIEDAGFDIRDQVMWLYGSGFPKSLDVSKAIDKAAGAEREVVGVSHIGGGGASNSKGFKDGSGGSMQQSSDGKSGIAITTPATDDAKQWQGWGTALKPANEPIVLARKPLSEKTVAANVLRWGTGCLNIDASRIGYTSEADKASATPQGKVTSKKPEDGYAKAAGIESERHEIERPELKGRWPSNLILNEESAQLLDAQSGVLKSGAKEPSNPNGLNQVYGKNMGGAAGSNASSGGASRFFYVAKASKRERGTENNHPTVKPIKLMEYLIKLITPPGGIVLDPFCGSGSTGVAAVSLGYEFVGIEREADYVKIAEARIKAKVS